MDHFLGGVTAHALTIVLLQYGLTEGVKVRRRIPESPRVLNQGDLFVDYPAFVNDSCPVQILFYKTLHPERHGAVSRREATIELVPVGGLQVLDDEAIVPELLAVVFN